MAAAMRWCLYRLTITLILSAWLALLVGQFRLGVGLSVEAGGCLAITAGLLTVHVMKSLRERGLRARICSALHSALTDVRTEVDALDEWILEESGAEPSSQTDRTFGAPSSVRTGFAIVSPPTSAIGDGNPIWRRRQTRED